MEPGQSKSLNNNNKVFHKQNLFICFTAKQALVKNQVYPQKYKDNCKETAKINCSTDDFCATLVA